MAANERKYSQTGSLDRTDFAITQLTQPCGDLAFSTADERRSTQIDGEGARKRMGVDQGVGGLPDHRVRNIPATPTAASSDQVSRFWNLHEFNHLR